MEELTIICSNLLGKFVLPIRQNFFIKGHSKTVIKVKTRLSSSHFELLLPRDQQDQQARKENIILAGVLDCDHLKEERLLLLLYNEDRE